VRHTDFAEIWSNDYTGSIVKLTLPAFWTNRISIEIHYKRCASKPDLSTAKQYGDRQMQKKYALIIIGIIVSFYVPVFAAQTPEDILNAIVKVILEAATIEVHNVQGDPVSARFVAYDYETGFGILRAEPPLSVKPLKLGQSSRLKEGDPILMVGFGGPEEVLGSRVVSRKAFAGYWEYLLENAIYTSPPYANYGGAALIDNKGELLGIGSIFTRLSVPGLGIMPCNMSVPIDLLKPILADLIDKGRSAKPPKPWLGVHADEAHGRVFIIRLTPGGPAEKAGIKVGDIILAVDQTPVKGLADFFRQIGRLGSAGVKVPLSILQETEVRSISVQSADRYQFLQVSRQR
jgi:S1-C subfamily serine protease